MADPFRRLILDTVGVIIEKDPNGDTLIELLKVATPDLDENDVIKDAGKREKLFKTLKLRIHPDKHTGNETATSLYQQVQPFYDRCVSNIHKRPSKDKPKPAPKPAPAPAPPPAQSQHRRTPSTNNNRPAPQRKPSVQVKIEFEFHVCKKWSYLSFDQPAFPSKGCSADGLAALVAYQCINTRGAIAHGRKTERFYSMEQVLQKPASVHEKFAMRGGVKQLLDVEAIKAELVTNGPVVSTSFVLTEAFAKRPENRGAFLASQIVKVHPVLIVGWRVTNMGDMWLIQPLKRSLSDKFLIPVAFGQFGIDVSCLAPKNTFEHVPWQNGPYFDHDMSAAPEWRTWPSLRMHLSSEELEKFAENVGVDGGIIALYEKKTTFVVRHKAKLAQSRRCRLREVKWDSKLGKWLVSCAFV